MRPSQAILTFALIGCSPTAWAFDDILPAQRQSVALGSQAATAEAPAKPTRSDTKQFRGFFGYLEFDVDPDAAGGVPGFGAISQPAPTFAQARSE
jgi:hypothetical protein